MPYPSREAFAKELFSMREEYRRENAWVQGWRQWNDDGIMSTFINAAYNLYKATASNALRLMVLGDTEIRSMAPLISNFGLMSAQGVQERNDEIMVKDLEQKRKQVAMGTEAGLKGVPKVLGVGSILSDKMWTPMLNDALMLGSIEGNQDFYVGLNTKEQAAWSTLGFNANVLRKAEVFGGAVATKRNVWESNWNTFFLKQPEMLWRDANPRVFARELLALKFFGYKPVYSQLGLAFAPNRGTKIGPPGFRTYTTSLRKVGFFANDKPSVMGAISEFLFNNPKALL